jgi:methylmalonyl-CoA mutase
VVTATSLFDGHDAAIHIVRRLLQAHGAEVIHLGHDRGVDEIVAAAVQEDADAVAVSSYQGGHDEFFRYLVDRLRAVGATGVRVYGGGGGTILPEEARALEAYGVARIFGPSEGKALGLDGMIDAVLADCAPDAARDDPGSDLAKLGVDTPVTIARLISWLERHGERGGPTVDDLRAKLDARAPKRAPVLGFTGTGGSGKSSVVDELVRRFRRDAPGSAIGLLLVDPSHRRSGGALLGDRIRMNAIHGPRIYARSLATRRAHRALSLAVADAVRVLRAAGFDLVIVETAGIGQADSEITDVADASVYVMTPEYGAPSQLEKIDMLDLADAVILNKSDRRGAADALRDVTKQRRRNRQRAGASNADLAVFPTIASQWDDPGVERAYEHLRARVAARGAEPWTEPRAHAATTLAPVAAEPPAALVPPERVRYLAEIAATVRGYRARTAALAERAADAAAMARALAALGDAPPAELAPYGEAAHADPSVGEAARALRRHYDDALLALDDDTRASLRAWQETRTRYEGERQSYRVRDRSIEVDNWVETLSHNRVPRVAVPRTNDWGELVRFLREENVPGRFPFAAGVFPFKRQEEDPTRMFAGEGPPERTNRRFHLLARGQPAPRLSTAFDSVTLYGRDPAERPDIYGKVGNSGVSVCTLDDAKRLYSGFDLCDPRTSVSMTINGPAPMLLAFFLNAAIDQQVERHLRETGRLDEVRARAARDGPLPSYRDALPPGHDGLGHGLLGIPGDAAVPPDVYSRIHDDVLRRVRGTVQADILKEDQAQNTCIFSTGFALRLMGDIQAWFIRHAVRNFYSVSISGYHIAEAGANPISQVAFTLANGFTYVEHYLARGMAIDDFAPNLSFFFSNGLDAEYNVIGRVARRIWAIAMRDCYGASERSQKLKYHVQTSGRSLHAQEMAFNDIRTTLQALAALSDQCNSLHTNAYDEAVTTPTEESVRRAVAIQLVIQRELGLGQNENPLQGAYVIEQLTETVERAILDEFDRLSERGGVLGAMETLYQRGRIQEESLHYESLKHSGKLPIIGVNTFENPDASASSARPRLLMRSTEAEKRAQLDGVGAFKSRWAARTGPALASLQEAARSGGNVFDALMDTVKYASLGQITDALFEVGGAYRRAM